MLARAGRRRPRDLPGGYGTTIHRAAGTLRRAGAQVHATGRAVVSASAWIDRGDAPGGRVPGGRVELAVSAETAGGMVILRIDEAPGAASAG